ncbi:hypothetical protein A5906_17460 [Bradyrhizobium sacchari]|uniref:LysR substrate-binding domain-containing protein n=1 Tax=Bradyrhizobium sacchari TaxID=1399419 RepID=UPI0009C76285|nr:LysR substrate-binding domain-containing protein [Bradyrhizobium sacchari]OPY93587.1 hypothetical protein A5906_17460 [Bradyrhizobium sacchari]
MISPTYLARCGAPTHPRDLVQHDCLTFATTGLTWDFESRRGPINVEVKARLSANDSQLLLRAAIAGMGVERIARHVAQPALSTGELVPLLVDYPFRSSGSKHSDSSPPDRPDQTSCIGQSRSALFQAAGRSPRKPSKQRRPASDFSP